MGAPTGEGEGCEVMGLPSIESSEASVTYKHHCFDGKHCSNCCSSDLAFSYALLDYLIVRLFSCRFLFCFFNYDVPVLDLKKRGKFVMLVFGDLQPTSEKNRYFFL
ncbi:hypothetical protein CEXT_243941 [Caerostris extrusa]|nr:hypothetical protein CEXT_243941 [Caerostris extrusa]